SQAAKKGDYKYRTVKGGVEITDYMGKDEDVKIPDRIDGKKVVGIGYEAFCDNKTIKKVTIPDTVEIIDENAFEECVNLQEIRLPKNLKSIEDEAFTGSGLVQVDIPDSVGYLGSDAFYACKNLKEVHLGENIKIIEGGCFEKCTQLSSINLENIEKIYWEAFKHDESITGVLNLDSVTTVGEQAFYGCAGIKEVNFSYRLKSLGYENPFAYCTGIEKFTIPDGNANYTCVDGVIYGKKDKSVVAWPAGRAEAAVLGRNVRKIYDYAFAGAHITSIAMEGQVKYIGEKAFAKSMITQASMPLSGNSKKVQWCSGAFKECRMLVKVVFPDKSFSSNQICFHNCTSLREVVLPDTMTELSDGMFIGCTALESITVPKLITKIPAACFYKCSGLKNINLGNISEIGALAFAHCSSLTGILSLNAQKIGVLSFENCTNISEVRFTKPLSEILYGYISRYRLGVSYRDVPE
ncbi:MAG: leucine-rich repeat domain-containing protein, partial [Lachnospiraceae bacterium]|nr:leucine-rich repeat domain-containing protein [Lachnospiraceae bacterium]